jgi:XRE family transcriptional regulator, aerobic/anaerobic benzoate catabolism transcriptional regulator
MLARKAVAEPSIRHYNAVTRPWIYRMTTVLDDASEGKDPFLVALGETLRMLRARRGMTRRTLAAEAGVSERHLANLETGVGNASILVLRQVATALETPLADLFDAGPGASPDAALIRDLLRDRSEGELQRARIALSRMFGGGAGAALRRTRIALIGLRGAGKSTLGRRLAAHFEYPFVELNREIERLAGCDVGEIHSLYGPSAYRRYERRALDDVVQRLREAVIATPGGLVSDPATFNRLLGGCFTIWLRATPEEHMSRVLAQGDYRPMAGNAEAMDDLRRILVGRTPFYAKADLAFDTSGKTLDESFAGLRQAIDRALTPDSVAAD